MSGGGLFSKPSNKKNEKEHADLAALVKNRLTNLGMKESDYGRTSYNQCRSLYCFCILCILGVVLTYCICVSVLWCVQFCVVVNGKEVMGMNFLRVTLFCFSKKSFQFNFKCVHVKSSVCLFSFYPECDIVNSFFVIEQLDHLLSQFRLIYQASKKFK